MFDVSWLSVNTIDTRRMMASDDEVQVVYKYLLHVIHQQNQISTRTGNPE